MTLRPAPPGTVVEAQRTRNLAAYDEYLKGTARMHRRGVGTLEAIDSFRRAIELEPTNPRIAFLDAMNTLHKPAFVGGGAAKARKREREGG